jgi:hypothetical protein
VKKHSIEEAPGVAAWSVSLGVIILLVLALAWARALDPGRFDPLALFVFLPLSAAYLFFCWLLG